MTLLCKVGTLPAHSYKVFDASGNRSRSAPKIGESFKLRDPAEPFGRLEPVRLLEIRETGRGRLFVCERF